MNVDNFKALVHKELVVQSVVRPNLKVNVCIAVYSKVWK